MVGNRTPVYPDLVLIENGVPRAVIVLSEQPTEKAKAAADDLCSVLEQMSGARLPIVSDAASVEGTRILVGESRETVALGIETPHGYPENERVLVQRKGDCLVLLGNDDEVFTGTAFAVTMLLEKLGCGWFGPEELWQEIPHKETIAVGYLHIDHVPAFESRQTFVFRRNPALARRWYMGGSNKQIDHAYHALSRGSSILSSIPNGTAWWTASATPTSIGGRCATPIPRWYRKPSGRWIST